MDGTKIESKANRYTFVWRKAVERELGKIREKARSLLGLESGYATRGKLAEQVESLDKEISEEGLTVQKGRGHHKPAKIRERDERKALLERWESYEQKKRILGDKRNSYSKTDPEATFMHMKDDHMRNGQLKPGYNVQFAVNSQFIVGLGVFPDRTDYATLPPVLEMLKERLGFRFRRVVADSGLSSGAAAFGRNRWGLIGAVLISMGSLRHLPRKIDRDGFQVFLRLAVQNQFCVCRWIVPDQVIQF